MVDNNSFCIPVEKDVHGKNTLQRESGFLVIIVACGKFVGSFADDVHGFLFHLWVNGGNLVAGLYDFCLDIFGTASAV